MNHNPETCTVPFCKECWAILKGNLLGLKRVADELLEISSQQSTSPDGSAEHGGQR